MKIFFVFLTIFIFAFCGRADKNMLPADQQHEHEGQEQEGPEHEVTQKQKAAEPEEHEHDELQLSPEKQKAWGIELGSATRENISSKITLPGVLSLDLNKTAHISSFVQGKVVSLSTDLGARVNKGQALLTINSPEFAQAQADFLQARARFILSRKEFERAKMLFKEKAIEEKEYLRRQAENEKMATEYGALGSALHSYGITHKEIDELIKKCTSMEKEEYMCELADPNLPILSPISGTIIFRDVIVGEHVEPQKILFTASNLNTLWALLDAYEKDLPFINKKSKVTIVSPLYPEKEFTGKIALISDTIDEKLRTIKIRVEVKNDEGLLKPNMYIQGIIENEAVGKKFLAVPEEAVQNINGEKIIFVLDEKDTFAVRHIILGKKIGKKRIIVSGLEKGEQIVIKGAFYLKAELNKATFGSTHIH